RLKIIEGVSGTADPYQKWYNIFNLNYDWDAPSSSSSSNPGSSSSSNPGSSSSSNPGSSSSSIPNSSSSSMQLTEIEYNVSLATSSNYASVSQNLDKAK